MEHLLATGATEYMHMGTRHAGNTKEDERNKGPAAVSPRGCGGSDTVAREGNEGGTEEECRGDEDRGSPRGDGRVAVLAGRRSTGHA